MFAGTHQKWLFEWSHGRTLLPARSAGESSFQDSRLGACAHVHPHLSSSPLLSLVRTPISTLPLNERWYTFQVSKRRVIGQTTFWIMSRAEIALDKVAKSGILYLRPNGLKNLLIKKTNRSDNVAGMKGTLNEQSSSESHPRY